MLFRSVPALAQLRFGPDSLCINVPPPPNAKASRNRTSLLRAATALLGDLDDDLGGRNHTLPPVGPARAVYTLRIRSSVPYRCPFSLFSRLLLFVPPSGTPYEHRNPPANLSRLPSISHRSHIHKGILVRPSLLSSPRTPPAFLPRALAPHLYRHVSSTWRDTPQQG